MDKTLNQILSNTTYSSRKSYANLKYHSSIASCWAEIILWFYEPLWPDTRTYHSRAAEMGLENKEKFKLHENGEHKNSYELIAFMIFY